MSSRPGQDAVAADLTGRGLDGLLMFKQESMYYLTGYDSFGYCFFQCLILGADGNLTLLTRLPDLQQARLTSIIEDVRLWYDAPDANPGSELMRILHDLGYKGNKLGIEFDSYGLTASSWRSVEAALDGFCEVEDASDVVRSRRAIKSPAELEYVRRAAELADDALDAAAELAQPGAFEGDVLAGMHSAIFKGGGDYAGNEFIIGSGTEATLVRYHSGPTAPGRAGPAHAGVRRGVPTLPRLSDAHGPGRHTGTRTRRHVRSLPGRAACVHRGGKTGRDDGVGLRRARPRDGRRRVP